MQHKSIGADGRALNLDQRNRTPRHRTGAGGTLLETPKELSGLLQASEERHGRQKGSAQSLSSLQQILRFQPSVADANK
jgi:hypothetical protein